MHRQPVCPWSSPSIRSIRTAPTPEKIKEQLAGMNILVEDWGGKFQSQAISAKKGLNVDLLLEKIGLEAELLDLKANPDRKPPAVSSKPPSIRAAGTSPPCWSRTAP